MDRRQFAIGAIAAASLPGEAGAEEPEGLSAALRQRILRRMEACRVPGCAVAVVKDGQTLAAEGFGYASLPFRVPVNAHSLFHLGSVSKQFTAAEVIALLRERQISLSDPIGRHVLDLPPGLAAPPILTLLNHTSGIPDYEGLPGFDADRFIDRPSFVRGVAAMPRDFAPGSAWSYSNTGYVLLGYLIADLTGRSYQDAVRRRLIHPAGLAETRFDDATAIIPGRTEPYVLSGEEIRHATQMDGDYSGWPDGGMLMSAHDAALWETTLQRGAVIPRHDFELLTRPPTLTTGRGTAYGMGWFTDRTQGRSIQYHSGSVPGFLAFYWRVPSLNLGAITFVNLESRSSASAIRRITHEICEDCAQGSTYLSLSPIYDRHPTLTREAMSIIMRGDSPLPQRLAPELAELRRDRADMPDRSSEGELVFEVVEEFVEHTGLIRRYRATSTGDVEHFAFAYDQAERIYRVRAV